MHRKSKFDFAYWDVFWVKLVWAPQKGRWAYFTRREDRELFRRYIEVRLDDEEEKRDTAESLRLLKEAAKNATLVKMAVLTAYRSRLRRAGARYRLEKMEQ